MAYNRTIELLIVTSAKLRACSYGEKLSRLARKHFDKPASEISPCYENNMKSSTAFIWDEKFSRVPRPRYTTGEISVAGIMFSPHEHNIYTTFPLSGKTFCRVSNFSIVLFDSATSPSETLPGNRDNFLHMNRTKLSG